MIDNIFLPSTSGEKFIANDMDAYLTDLGKVNLFVGPNNSGKSRLLRHITSKSLHGFNSAEAHVTGIWNQITGFNSEINDELSSLEIPELFKKFQVSPPPHGPSNIDVVWAQEVRRKIHDAIHGAVATQLKEALDNEDAQREFLRIASAQYDAIDKLIRQKTPIELVSTTRVYVPILRGLRPFQGTSDDPYQERTVSDYFPKPPTFTMATGLNLYEKVDEYYRGSAQMRNVHEEFQNFLSVEFFDGKKLRLIPQRGRDVLFIAIEGEERPIYDLGDGVQQMIILTAPAFFGGDQGGILCIEEPELCLHPGMQRRLLDIYANHPHFEPWQIFLTSHSNHFLDMTLEMNDIRVLRFQNISTPEQTAEGNSEYRVLDSSRRDFALLRDLGVRNSSVFLTNCTIWVEGICDRVYLRKYLEIYQKEKVSAEHRFREDTHYSLAQYGGSNLKHWIFSDDPEEDNETGAQTVARHLCGRALVIADRDSKKETVHRDRADELGMRYLPLECREIENSLKWPVIQETVRSYATCVEAQFGRVDIVESEFRSLPIGDFIDNEMVSKKGQKSFAAQDGRLKEPKLDFAFKACEQIQSYDDLSSEAVRIAEYMYNFIKDHNQT